MEKLEHQEFKVYILNEHGIEKAKEIKRIFEECLDAILHHCPPGRELSIVKTKLEEACFFAKKSMAQFEVNQK